MGSGKWGLATALCVHFVVVFDVLVLVLARRVAADPFRCIQPFQTASFFLSRTLSVSLSLSVTLCARSAFYGPGPRITIYDGFSR